MPPLGDEHRVPAPNPQPASAKALGVKWRRGSAGAQGQGQGQGWGEAGAAGLSRGAHECDWELECELVWEPPFSASGSPLHEGYHVWALLHGASSSPGEAAAGSGRDQAQQHGQQGHGQGQGTAEDLPGSTSSGSSNSSPDSWDAVAVAEKGPAKADPASSGPEGTEGQSDATSGGTLPLEGPDSPHWIKVSGIRVWRSVGLLQRCEEGASQWPFTMVQKASMNAAGMHGCDCLIQPGWLNLRV